MVKMQDACAFFHFFAARVVLSARVLMLDHGIADDEPHMSGNGQQAIFERSAIQHQGMVLLPGAGNELVHDAAARAYEGIFRALAGKCDGGQRQRSAGQLQQGECGGDFDRRRRT